MLGSIVPLTRPTWHRWPPYHRAMTAAAPLDRERLHRRLDKAFGGGATGPGDRRIVRAPGRVNIIGEHTDYNDGFVLPVAIDLEVRLAIVPVDEPRIRLVGDDGSTATIELAPLPPPGDAWHDYVAGTAWALREAGQPLHGFDAVLASTVPIGAGPSSSAALEVAAAWALSGPDLPALSPLEVAKLAQRAENEHVGVRCGLMDQFASACGVAGHAMLLDCRTTEWRAVPLPDDLALVVIHSGVTHAHGDNEYNERRAACERAVAIIAERHPGVTALRDVDLLMLEAERSRLGARIFDRAHHVITENQRVLDAVHALETGDHQALGALMAASQATMRDRYEISCPEIDVLVEIAVATPGVVGSRLTGGGFGGCTVSLVAPDAVESLRRRVERDYPARTGMTPRQWTLRAVDGAGFVEE